MKKDIHPKINIVTVTNLDESWSTIMCYNNPTLFINASKVNHIAWSKDTSTINVNNTKILNINSFFN